MKDAVIIKKAFGYNLEKRSVQGMRSQKFIISFDGEVVFDISHLITGLGESVAIFERFINLIAFKVEDFKINGAVILGRDIEFHFNGECLSIIPQVKDLYRFTYHDEFEQKYYSGFVADNGEIVFSENSKILGLKLCTDFKLNKIFIEKINENIKKQNEETSSMLLIND